MLSESSARLIGNGVELLTWYTVKETMPNTKESFAGRVVIGCGKILIGAALGTLVRSKMAEYIQKSQQRSQQ